MDPVAARRPRPLWLRLLPVAAIAAGFVLVFATGMNRYLSLEVLQAKRVALLSLVRAHPVAGPAIYLGLYVLAVVLSLPGSMVLTLAGGFLFGPVIGTAAAVIGASIGATILFLVMRSAAGEVLRAHARPGGAVAKLEAGVRANAFSSILVLRLVPAIPFWLCNLAAGFVDIPLKTYVAATVLGIIPATAIFSSIGSGLGQVFDRADHPDLGLILNPRVALPLAGLALLSALPPMVHAWRLRRARSRA